MNKKNVFALIGPLLVALFFAKICLCQDKNTDWWSLRENIRTVVGFEQAAASSAQTARKYFFNLFLKDKNFVFCCAGRMIVQTLILPRPIVGNDNSGRCRISS
jgi:hypothetical protein